MNKEETLRLMVMVKGLWQEQATDKATQAVWAELFKGVSYQAGRNAVAAIARMGGDRPAPGLIYKQAAENDAIAAERDRASRKALPEPPLSDAEITRNKKKLQDIVNSLSKKMAR